MKKDKKAFSMIIAIGIVFVSILAALTIVEYMIPFLKNIRGVENSVGAYYNSYSGLEKGLYFLSTRVKETDEEKVPSYDENGMVGYEYETFSSGTTLPAPTTGDSEFNQNYNTISMGSPIQLSVGYKYLENISDLSIEFKVPKLNLGLKSDLKETNELNDEINIINWQLSSENATLNSTGASSLISAKEINKGDIDKGQEIKLEDGKFQGNLINQESTGAIHPQNINEFYENNCKNETSKCILRFSVINPLKLTNPNTMAPYLEWKITTEGGKTIPLRYSRIKSTGKEYGFKKELTIRVPQDTISEAFDFTVFQ